MRNLTVRKKPMGQIPIRMMTMRKARNLKKATKMSK
jgi:hypothetical protein